MAYVALTDEQKEILLHNTRFQSLVEWGMFNKARYWVQLDGSSVPGGDRINWSKSRTFSSNVVLRSFDIGTQYDKLFLTLMTHPVYDNSVAFNVDTVLNYMIAAATFESVTDLIYIEKTKEILF